LVGSFGASHLTLHGLWPNYTDAESAGKSQAWPEFCGAYRRCKAGHDATCEPDPSTIPGEMRELGPGYVGDHAFLATHEWPKHGSCTGMTSSAYFRAALDAMKSLPGEGTPDKLRAAIGADVAADELVRGFGVPADSVLLGCDAHCRLQQISFCLAHDASGKPTTPIACPVNTTNSRYDNGCVTRRCERIAITETGACGATPSERRPHGDLQMGRGHACNHPGQGPSCAGNDECVKAGYVRCARSGCCTSQP
jgi:ribonuclease T2